MDIDIERLKTDAEYWLDNDPSDGEATHFELEYSGHECAWVRVDRKGLRHYFLDGGWVCADMTNDDIGPVERMIPRPTKPSAQDWDGEGLPPVGVVCECFSDGVESERCEIVAYDDQNVCVRWWKFNNGRLDVLRKNHWEFRPLRTTEQRRREELQAIIYEHGAKDGPEIILSRYNLEPKGA